MNRLDQKYRETVVPALMKKFEYKSVMEVPCIDKVVINMGVGDAIANSKALDDAVAELRNQSQTSRCVKACRSAARSRCAVRRCMISWIS